MEVTDDNHLMPAPERRASGDGAARLVVGVLLCLALMAAGAALVTRNGPSAPRVEAWSGR